MHLLQYSEDGEISRHAFDDGAIPAYAILSHTWGADGDEVTFADLGTSHAMSKPGYKKILFCGEQAQRDNLRYFWIDTCCIDKNNKAEYAFSIRSMFRWYRNATRCYVYLSDVSVQPSMIEHSRKELWWLVYIWLSSVVYFLLGWSSSPIQQAAWSRRVARTSIASSQEKPQFVMDQSRWFTRGWTLQELLAPSTVEFFSREGVKLGDKTSLAKELLRITRIPIAALQGESLSDFNIHERISWSEHRMTTVEEDRAYSLMGILGVSLSPINGEGASNAMKRVHDEVGKLDRCFQDLRPSDPRADKKRIEDTKGGLLTDSYRWVLENTMFKQWRQHEGNQLLWVKGDPGKGKTMLLCERESTDFVRKLQGIIDELQASTSQTVLLSYFFCQATDSRINSATAVLRGLLSMLLHQEPLLMSHVRRKYDLAGKGLFEDTNAWVELAEIFTEMLQDKSISTTKCLVIDALDECIIDQPKLLNFIAKNSSASARIRWVISSRNWPVIEEYLERANQKSILSLELNADSVAIAVKTFIQKKVSQLAQKKLYTQPVQDAVLQHLMANSNDTFLWVALVCQDLEGAQKWETFDQTRALEKLALFPPGLDSLYLRMLQQIHESGSAELCFRILAVIAVVYRPIMVSELTALIRHLGDFADALELVREMINLCGSFLTMRDDTVYFVHQSAKDFLFAKASNEVFANGIEDTHQAIFSASLACLSKTLHKDMYGLNALGCAIEHVKLPLPDPLRTSRYPCVHWIDHLCDSKPTISVNCVDHPKDEEQWTAVTYEFLKQNCLYWLEGLSLCGSIEKGVTSMVKLLILVRRFDQPNELARFIEDAHRFMNYHKQVVETFPLQVYASALLFSPANSLVRQVFKLEEPQDIAIKPTLSRNWNACLQTLEGHSKDVKYVVSSQDSKMLASASYEDIKLWDLDGGGRMQTLEGHGLDQTVKVIAFSSDSTRLATASGTTAKIWDTSDGACIKVLDGFEANSMAYSHDLKRLASGFGDYVKIWEVDSGTCVRSLEGHRQMVDMVVFSHDSSKLAVVYDEAVKIWDMKSFMCLQTLEEHGDNGNQIVNAVAFNDSTSLASASNMIIQIWDIGSGTCLQTLRGHTHVVNSVTFSPHSTTGVVSTSEDGAVKIWNSNNGNCLQTLRGHNQAVNSASFLLDEMTLVSASDDKSVKIWDISHKTSPEMLEGHTKSVPFVVFSHDSKMLASASEDRTIKIWDTSSGACLRTLRRHGSGIYSVVFSHDSKTLASASHDRTIKIWNPNTGACLQTLQGHQQTVRSLAYSHDSTRLASACSDGSIMIWDTGKDNVECIQTLTGHSSYVTSVAYSHDSTRLASASDDETVKLWDMRNDSGVCQHTLEGHQSMVTSVAFSRDSTRLASACFDMTVKIWDVGSDSSATCLRTMEGYTYRLKSPGLISILDSLEFDQDGRASHSQVKQGPSISPDRTWIYNNGERLVWIPPEYRASQPAVSGNYIGMGTRSGKVWICQLL